ncbi:MAG: glycosyltransferase family 2 protein [Candidatus Nanopelagicales bacterium]|nr:glycosyltransferase family 2 protein [Candidatus Nanopelagicales bacterium]
MSVHITRKRGLLNSGQGGIVARIVVFVVILVPIAVATATAFAAKYLDGDPFNPEPLVFSIAGWQIAVISSAPRMDLLVLSAAGLIVVALGSVILEGGASLRILHPLRNQLPWALPWSPEGQPPTVVVVLPAHNEETTLPATLQALMKQTRPPDRIIVAADNCQDNTAQVARDLGAEVVTTVGNTGRKAGALNQVLAQVLPTLRRWDFVLIADADTVLNPRFLETGVTVMVNDPGIDAVGGMFFGEEGAGLLGQFQRNEYERYQLQIKQRRGRVFVLTGTASIFRAETLADVAQARGALLPGRPGDIYDTSALTEDNELTLALKTLGCRMTSPPGCSVATEIMPTWRALWTQRKRWQRGALENLGSYGFTTATLRYWGQQFGLGYGVIALTTAYLLLLISALAVNTWQWFPFWVAVTVIYGVERTVTVARGGFKAMAVAAPLVLEVAYAFYLQAVFISVLKDIVVQRTARWGHVQREGAIDES